MNSQGRVAVAFAAVVAALGSPAGDAARVDTSAAATQLSNRELAGVRVVSGFDGREPPAKLRRLIGNGDICGVILFSDNVVDRAQVRRLTDELQSIPRPASVDEPLLVMVDQEGGQVRRLPGPPKPSAAAVGRRGAAFARKLGEATGSSLAGMGVNVNLAPVLDVARPGGFIAAERRSFGRKPGLVAKVGTAFAKAMQGAGIAAAKHFPGLGSARRSTDEQPVKVRLSRRILREVDERPYERYIAGGGSLVMLSMASYPALGPGPAALSKAIATRELRGRLGFKGVSVSDALGTPAAAAIGSTAKVAVRGAQAGTDLLLFGDLGEAARASHALRRALAAGVLPRDRAEASAARVLDLRGSLGG